MADHLDEPPQKRVKMETFRQTSDQGKFISNALSNYDIFGLEDNLPDELVSTGNSGGWVDQLPGSKPPAQGPGPGQMNGEDPTGGVGVGGPQVGGPGGPGGVPANVALRMQQQQFLMQQGNKNLVGNTINMGPLASKSPNLQSPSNLQGNMPNMVGGMINSMSMSIANNGTQNMNMQGMNSIASQGGIGNVILTNSNIGPMGMQGGGMVTPNLKQQLTGGNALLQGNLIGAGGPQGNAMHHGGLGGQHPNVQTIQNGPIMNVSVGNRMISQQHTIMRGPNPHLMQGGAGGGNVGPVVGNPGPRMQNPNIPNIGNFSNTTKILSNQFTQSQTGNVNLGQITMTGGGPNGPYVGAYTGGNPNQQQGNINVVNPSVASALGGPQQQQNMITIAQQRAVPPNILMQQQQAAAAAVAQQQQQLQQQQQQQQQGNRPGGPIGSNLVGAGGIVGNDGQTVGNAQNNPGGLVNQQGMNQQQQNLAPTGVQQQRPPLLGQQGQQQQQQQQQQNAQQNQMQQQQQPGNGPVGQPGQPGPANPIQQQQQQQASSDKKKQIQQQLMLLLHAHKCSRRENENPNNPPDCKIPHCKTMKDVLAHMATCKANKDCSVAHCISSRQILVHWKSCQKPDCGICLPFRQGDKLRQPGTSGMQQQQNIQNQQQQQQQNVPNSTIVQQNQQGVPISNQQGSLAGQMIGMNQQQQQQQQQQNATVTAAQLNQQKMNQSEFEKMQQQQKAGNRFEQQMQGGIPNAVSNANLMQGNQNQPQMTANLVGNQNVRMPNASGVQVLLPGRQPNSLQGNILMQQDMQPGGANNQQQLLNQNIVSLGNQQQNSLNAMQQQQQQSQLNANSQAGVGVPGGPGGTPNSQSGPNNQNIPMFPNNSNTTPSGPPSVGDGTTKPLTGVQLQQQMNKLASAPGGPGAPPQLPPGMPSVSTMPSGVTKDWHSSVTADLRNHLVHKLVQAIFPTSDPNTMMDKRMHNLVSYAEKVEKDMYEMANCRSEYYHLLAEKIYKIQKELEEKRQKRKEAQLAMQQQNNQNMQGQLGGQSLPPGHMNAGVGQMRPNSGLIPNSMVSPLGGGNVNNMQGVMRVPGPSPSGLVNQQQAQVAAAMRSHSPGGLPGQNVANMQAARMQFNPNQQNLNNANTNMLVSQSGPSPNSLGNSLQNPVLSPFQNQGSIMTNAGSSNGPGNMNATTQFINSNSGPGSNGPNVHTAANINQFNEMLKARQQQQQQQQQQTSQLSAQNMQQNLPQAPSPFSNQQPQQQQQSSAGQINSQNSTPNAFVRNTNSNPNLPPTPTSVLDQLSNVSTASSVGGGINTVAGMTTTAIASSNNSQQSNNLVPVPSPSPSLSSNGPVQVGTPSGPPSVPSMLQSLTATSMVSSGVDLPTPTPPLMTSPMQNNSTTVTPSVTPTLQSSMGKGGNSNSSSQGGNSMPLPSSRQTLSSSNLSSQMAALEAAARDDDDTPPSPGDNQGGGNMQKGKLDSVKNEDDIKKEMEDDQPGAGTGKNVNNDGTEVKMEIKSEPMDTDGNPIKTENDSKDVKIKDEPMSPSSTQEKVKPVVPEPLANLASDKKKKCVFNPEELRQALMPTLEKLFRQDPESMPFRSPVNPQALGIPDYFDIVKKPMDLSTIKDKLVSGKFNDPWEYVDDVWLMFDNAWLYNRKTSRVYRYCTKLSEIFEQEIDPVMQALGYCCGRKYTFNPQVLCCYGKQLCTIPRDAKYYSYQNSLKAYGVVSDRYTFCQKCFNEIPGDTVTLGDDPMQPQTQIKKDQFKEMKNDHLELEPFVDCQECGRKQHQICVLYLESIWPGGFTCNNCMKKKGIKRKENKFSAKRLPTTKLGIYIETRVNNFLKKKEAGAGEVHIRVVSSSDKVVEVKPGMRRRFVENSELQGEFPYRAKALFAFEEVDGVDVCFFGMHVQEYGSECPTPNTRRVYIAYLDSVHFFRPRQYRTAVYHEILLGYMDYVKQLGFTMAHIWACPPSEGDDYIFHCHPPDQKIPKPKRLQEWYKKMLDKGMIERTIQDYKDILKQAMEDKLTSAAELPYFEGDFWPNVLEESIKELDQEEEEKRKQAEAAEAAANAAMFSVNEDPEASGDGKKKGSQKKAKKSNKSKANQRKNNKKSNEQQNGNDLTAKIFATMEKHKEVFFVIRLHSAQSAASLAPIQDPDPLMNCDLMDGRDAFLTMARDKHFEFSSLRRAQFSTLNMLYELHNQGQDKFVYTCNNCKTPVETRYHCTVCDDFDLCMQCKEKVGHPHKMEKLGLDLDDGTSPGGDASKQANPQEARKQSIQRCIQSLVHACQCRDANCRLPSCQKMKRVVSHTKNCKRKTNGGCPICKQLIALCCYHAKHCQEAKCLVPFCPNIKHKLKQQQLQQRLQQAQLLRRRMAVMNTRTMAPAPTAMPQGGVPTMGTPVVGGPGSGGMSPQTVPSPVNPMSGMTSPHHPSMGMKPGIQTPSPNVLQVVKQVQEEAARQQVPSNGGFGKVVPTGPQMAPPNMQRQFGVGVVPNQPGQPSHAGVQIGPSGPTATGNNLLPMEQWGNRYPNNANQPGLRPPNQQIMQQGGMPTQNMMQMVNPGNSGQMGQLAMRPQVPQQGQPGMGGGGGQQPNLSLNTQQLSQIMQKIKNNPSNEGHNQILQMLKSNPQIMAAIIKQRQQSQNQAGNAGAGGSGTVVGQGNPQVGPGPGGPMGPGPGPGVGPQQGSHLQQMMTQQQQQQHPNQVVMNPNQVPHNRMPMQNPGMMQGGGGMQQGPPVQNAAWYKQQQMLRQMQITQNYPAPPGYPQRPRAPQMGQMGPGGPGGPGGMGPGQFQGPGGGGSFNPNDQYAMQQGLKPQTIGVQGVQGMGGPGGQLMQPGGVPLGPGGLGGVGVGVGQPGQQNVMGPPHTMQQQLMQSPPPIRSPQPTPSPRSAPSPRAQPSASPRAQPSPHHLPSHSPAPQGVGGPNDIHNHMHPHQSPIGPGGGPGGGPPNDGGPGGVGVVGGPNSDATLTAQDQLTKFVEQL